MNRIAFQEYLRDLRDLELIRRKINLRYQQARREYADRLTDWMNQEQIMQTKRSGAAVWPFVTFAVVFAVVGALLVFLGGYDITSGVMHIGRSKKEYDAISTGPTWWNILLIVFGIIGMCGGVLLGFAGRYRIFRNEMRKKRREEDHAHQRRVMEEKWEKSRARLKEEKDQVDEVLQAAYSYGILPERYQELPSVYYLYLRMDNTNMSLNALLRQEERVHDLRNYRERLRREIIKHEDECLRKRREEIASNRTVMTNLKMLSDMAVADPTRAALYQAVAEVYASACTVFSRIDI